MDLLIRDSAENEEEIGSNWFWEIIQKANLHRDNLRRLLMEMTKEEIYRFQDEFLEASSMLKDAPFIDFVIPSEDGMEDIANWVVSQGKDYYLDILRNPSHIPYQVTESDPSILYGVADEVYEERFSELLPLY